MKWIPGAGPLLRNSRMQAFTEILHLMVRQQIPLHQSLRLAGDASGDSQLQNEARELADQIERGESGSSPVKSNSKSKRGIPPFLRWSIAHTSQAGGLEHSLQRSAETYRQRTLHSADWLRRTLPVIFSFSLGGIVSVFYAATVLVPWFAVNKALSAAMESM